MSSRDQLYSYANGEQHEGKTPKDVFQEIYHKHTWNIKTHDSVSGEGSNAEQTYTLRKELPGLLKKLKVRTMLDIPCGDFHWMQQVEAGNTHYIGADIVPELVQKNEQLYGNGHRQFMLIDLIHDPLPKADLIFCRDCLVHLSFKDIQSALNNIKSSEASGRATYLLTTHFAEEDQNKDIVTGGWRPLNFCLPPFNFPEPVEVINENCSEMGGAFQDKTMALWYVRDI